MLVFILATQGEHVLLLTPYDVTSGLISARNWQIPWPRANLCSLQLSDTSLSGGPQEIAIFKRAGQFVIITWRLPAATSDH